jgi:predicted MFS family arabinose efflux permease
MKTTDPNSLRAVVAMMSLCILGNSILMIQPMLVGAMVDTLGFSEPRAGVVIVGEMTGFTLASLAASLVLHIWNRRAIAVAGITLVFLCNLLASTATEFTPLLAYRAIAGMGSGFLLSSFNATAAATREPERIYGLGFGLFLGVGALFLVVVPDVIIEAGLKGTYLAVAALCVPVLAITVLWLPRYTPQVKRQIDGAPEKTRIGVLMFLANILVLYVGHQAIWAYQERMGVAIGLDISTVGLILGIALATGFLGAWIAWGFGVRFGRTITQVVSLSISILAALLLVYGGSLFTYAAASILIPLSWYYGLPYMIGIAAWLDPSGRAVTVGGAMWPIGSALGPAIAAYVIANTNGYLAIGWVGVICYVICATLIIPLAVKIDRIERNQQLNDPRQSPLQGGGN